MFKAKEDTTRFRRTTSAAGRSNVVPFPGQNPASAGSDSHELHKSQAQRAARQNIVPNLIFTVRKDGMVLDVHAPKDNELSASASNAVGRRLMDSLPVQIGTQAMHYIEKAVRTGQTQVFS